MQSVEQRSRCHRHAHGVKWRGCFNKHLSLIISTLAESPLNSCFRLHMRTQKAVAGGDPGAGEPIWPTAQECRDSALLLHEFASHFTSFCLFVSAAPQIHSLSGSVVYHGSFCALIIVGLAGSHFHHFHISTYPHAVPRPAKSHHRLTRDSDPCAQSPASSTGELEIVSNPRINTFRVLKLPQTRTYRIRKALPRSEHPTTATAILPTSNRRGSSRDSRPRHGEVLVDYVPPAGPPSRLRASSISSEMTCAVARLDLVVYICAAKGATGSAGLSPCLLSMRLRSPPSASSSICHPSLFLRSYASGQASPSSA